MGWILFFKMLAILFFLCCAMQLTAEEKEGLLGTIPFAGCVMTVIGILSYLVKPTCGFY